MRAVSIEVPLDELAAAVAARRFGYLVTVGDDGHAHVVAFVPEATGHRLRFQAGAAALKVFLNFGRPLSPAREAWFLDMRDKYKRERR